MQSSLDPSRQQLLDSLRGSRMVIPDLQAIFARWPQGANPCLGLLTQDVNERLEMLFPEGERLRQMKAADAASFAASWWPYASFETLRIATYLSIWLFTWDDETDSAAFSSYACSMDRASAFRGETIEFIRQCLTVNVNPAGEKSPSSTIIKSFAPVGQAVCQSCTPAQRTTLLKELEFFVEMTHLEQECQLRGELPTVEEYKRRRMGSSAVRVCLAISEYCLGVTISPEIMVLDDMQALWDETTMIISTSNDLLSIKKEMAQNQVDTLIPLLYMRHGDLQRAVEEAVNMLRSSVTKFETLAGKLLTRHVEDVVLFSKLQLFIYSCQVACTANLNWSLYSGRYGLECQSTKDGIQLTL